MQAVRAAALPAVSTSGTKLAREKTVRRESQSESEIVLRVRAPGHVVPWTVVLYPTDLEWTCDCDSRTDPCVHVVAASIALAQPELLAENSETKAPAHVRYLLSRPEPAALSLDRELVSEGRAEPLRVAVSSLVAAGNVTVAIEQHDIELDNIIRAGRSGRLVLSRIEDTLRALSLAQDVHFEGEPVVVQSEPLMPRASVTRDNQGSYVLRVEAAHGLTERVVPGVALLGRVLRPLGCMELTGMNLERLPIERRFHPEKLGELVSRALPELEARLDVEIHCALPGRQRIETKPRIEFQLENTEQGLSVLPLLVYGDPPSARVDRDQLVHLSGDIPKRNLVLERNLVERLRSELNLVPGRGVNYEGPLAARFTEKLLAFERTLHPTRKGSEGPKPLAMAVGFEGVKLSLTFSVEGSPEKTVPVASVLNAWQEGLSLVAVPGGGFAELPLARLAELGPWLTELWALRNTDGALPKLAAPIVAELCEELELPLPVDFSSLKHLSENFEGLPEAVLPSDLTATLRPYQHLGVNWLSFLRNAELGALLADDMGLGKTLETLAAIQGRTLVICPKSVVFNWAAEIQRFRPALKVALYQGSERTLDATADITLTTYGLLRLDIDTLAQEPFDTIVVDEAQAIKNPDSQVARAAFRLQGKFKIALSGTPVENRLDDLWSQMHFINPGLLGTRRDFQERYATPIREGDQTAQARLRRRIRPFVLRRLKREVAPELPPRTDIVLTVELEPNEREIYTAIQQSTARDVLAQFRDGGNTFAVFEALLRLRQAACHLALLPGKKDHTGSSKLTCLMERLEDVIGEGHKAIVFSQWTSLLDLVEPELHARDASFVRLDGATDNRQEVVNNFQSDTGASILLASLKAGGTGLNLTAADHVFLLDPWWNPAAEDQAADRAHRIGQTRPVFLYRVVAKDTIDERILALQEKKRSLLDAALTPGAVGQGLTREDLMSLLA